MFYRFCPVFVRFFQGMHCFDCRCVFFYRFFLFDLAKMEPEIKLTTKRLYEYLKSKKKEEI